MKSTIVTIFPSPAERYKAARPALNEASSAPPSERPKLVKRPVETLPSIESVILQKLLAELESRQVTRAQPTYDIEPSLPPNRITLHRILWGTTWVLSIAVTALAVNYLDGRTLAATTGGRESHSIEELTANLARQTDAFSGITSSLQQLAAVIASRGNRTVTIREMPQPQPQPLQQAQAAVVQSPPSVLQPAVPVIIGTAGPKIDSSSLLLGGHIHPPAEWLVAPANAVVHHNSMGVMDYWLLPRTMGGNTVMTKVVPVLQNDSGIFVHSVAEVKDYVVTPSGDWIAVPDTKDKN